MNDVIPFKYTRDQFGFMSNFHPTPVEYGGRIWKTTEHLYQAAKFYDRQQIIELVHQAPTAKGSKAIAWQHPCRNDWDDVKVAVMIECVGIKVVQHERTSFELFEQARQLTINRNPFVEDSSRDSFWGAKRLHGNWVGQNMLGKIWNFYYRCWLNNEPIHIKHLNVLPIKDPTVDISEFFN